VEGVLNVGWTWLLLGPRIFWPKLMTRALSFGGDMGHMIHFKGIAIWVCFEFKDNPKLEFHLKI
jgi:hypothetical protein